MESESQFAIVHHTADIVSAFVTSHKLDSAQLTKLIEDVHRALVRAPAAAAQPEREVRVPAVPIKKSIEPDFITSLEDGRKFKSLKRYLRRQGMTPDEYRAKWGLPRDYPMVAPNYAKKRSELAKKIGLGHKPAAAKKAPRKRAAKKTSQPRPALASLET
jgi:predicted transcriptional regulator